ncbi:MAG: hypothetical protein HY287_12035 [Planctomycetes bacterium]|nr:hypothetical protein [Planctomycetota bacterium]
MAKQLVNPIERHVEKLVLAITGLVLLYTIAFYLITTPNTLELGTDKVTPQTIDSKVAAKGSETLERIRATQTKVTALDPVFPKFAGSLAPLDGKPLPPAVFVNPDVPLFDVVGGTNKAKLAAVLVPAKPLTTQGRSTFSMSVQGQPINVPVDWVTVAIAFDVKKQIETFKKAYGAMRMDVVYGLPELQRRTRHADGTWSDGDWKDIAASPAANPPREPRFEFAEGAGQASASKEDDKNREKFVSILREPLLQRELVRPRMHTRVNGAIWKFPLFGTYREVLLMDDELVRPNDPPANEPEDLYGLAGAPAKGVTTAPKTPEAALTQELEEAQRLLKSGLADLSEELATQAYNKGKDVRDAKDANPALKQKAEKFMKDAEQAIKDIHREVASGGKNKPAAKPGGESPDVKPPRTTHLTMQEIWIHDAGRDSIRAGETYQYRMKVRLFNMLAGLPDKMENPKDAAKIYLSSEWSEPTEPVTIEPSSYFFVTGDERPKDEVKFDLYRWFDGVWVKAPHGFKGTVGTFVAETQRTPVPSLENPSESDNALVPFSAEATVLDVDLDHPMRERKAGTSPKGVRFASSPTPSVQVAFIDGSGRLFDRDEATDKANPLRKDLENRGYKPVKLKPEK